MTQTGTADVALSGVRDGQDDGAEPRTVRSVVAHAAQTWPDRVAVRVDDRELTYAELPDRGAAVTAALNQLGVHTGDSVLIMLENCVEFIDIFVGCGSAGIVQVPVNIEYRGRLLRHAIEVSGAAVMIVDANFAKRLDDVGPFRALRTVVVVGDLVALNNDSVELRSYSQLLAAPNEGDDPRPVLESDPLAIMYTSGTTGPSKGVLIAQRHAYEYAHGAATSIEMCVGDVYYAPLPLFHIAGQWATVYASWIGGATAIVKRRFSVNDFWVDVREHGATVSFVLGAMAQFLTAQAPAADDADNPLDRLLMVPLVADLEDFRKRFAVRVTTCYGATDVNLPLMSDFDVMDPTVAGRPVDSMQVRLVDVNDNDVPTGEVGELVVRPAECWTTMIEYVGDPAATAAVFRNAWLHSGDLFRCDESGEFHFVDRLKDAIRRRGENISSYEVECEVNAHPGVAESAAIAVPSRHTEDDLGVVVTARQGSTLDVDELLAFIRERAPRFMVPDVVWVIDEMPKTPTGKIQKHLLRERFSTVRDEQAGHRKRDTDTG